MSDAGSLRRRPWRRPKSRSLTFPSGVTFTLDGFRSRWRIPSRARRPAPRPRRERWRRPAGAEAGLAQQLAIVSPGTSSMTRRRTPSTDSKLWMAAIFGWLKAARAAPPLEAGDPLAIVGKGLGQHLDRDLTAEPHVPRAPDLSHPPAPSASEISNGPIRVPGLIGHGGVPAIIARRAARDAFTD